MGLANGGLRPKFLEKIGGTSRLENRAFLGLIGASRVYRGLFGPDRDQRLDFPRGESLRN